MATGRILIKRTLIAYVPIILLLGFCSQVMAASVHLAWDASASPNISGYKIYIGNSSGAYDRILSVGNLTSYTIPDLVEGTWYFAVTAFDTSGNESNFSNEIEKQIGSASPPPSPVPCDFNGDSAVTRADWDLLSSQVLLVSPNTSVYDVNKDSKVNSLDLQIVANVAQRTGSCQ